MGVVFPRAFAFAVDDMGWSLGQDLFRNGGEGPSRLGVNRRMGLGDYKALVEVGKAVGVRIQGLFVLCEMDRENVCASYPTTTMHGSGWDNSENVCDGQSAIMEFVRSNAAYLEFGLHGVGHEHWTGDGRRVRAEWYDIENHKPWPEGELRAHLECYRKILAQYGISEKNGQSFPKSFVPCAYGYWWNPHGSRSLGALLGGLGVRYANTLFDEIRELNPPPGDNGGGFDHGVHVVNRLNYGNEWNSLAALPTLPLENQTSDFVETHWANWLAPEESGQPLVNLGFIEYYRAVQRSADRYAAKNTGQLHSQWLYNRYASVTESVPGEVRIDNSAMPAEAYENGLVGNMVLKLALEDGYHVSAADLDGLPIAAYFEECGFGFLYLPPLEKSKCLLRYTVSKESMDFFVWNDGTCDIFSVRSEGKEKMIDLRLYGTQSVKVRCPAHGAVRSRNTNIEVAGDRYDEATGFWEIKLCARDMQGERGIIVLS